MLCVSDEGDVQRSIHSEPVSFASAEAAWFHAAPALQPGRTAAPWVQDVVKCMDTLYRQRRIDLLHARILRIWGLRGVAPNPGRPRERSDWRIWHEAMERLDAPLRARGIVSPAIAPAWQDAAD